MSIFSAIPRPDEVYRFRSVDALIGPRKELYRQTIYLARPDQLNDPAEDAVNVVWQGDDILWPNLIRYFWRSFLASLVTRNIFLPGNHLLMPGYRRLDNLPDMNQAVESLVGRLHEDYSMQRAEVLTELARDDSPVDYYKLRILLSKLTPPEHYRPLSRPGLPPLDDFPGRFLQAMGKLLLSDWSVAGFTQDFSNPFLWAAYADDHAGVCLVFDRTSLEKIKPPRDCESERVELEEVSYQIRKPDIEFFSTGPRITVAEYEKLYCDENGAFSPRCTFFPEDSKNVEKRKELYSKRTDACRNHLLTKHKQWEAEREVRMFCRFFFDRPGDSEPEDYTVQYPIEALKGIIFGCRTTQEDKQAILEVVLAKHYVSPIGGHFVFGQAAQQPDGSVRKTFYSPYVDWQHKFLYPRNR